MSVITLSVIALLCLAFRSTRMAGVAGLTLLSLIYPLLFVSLLIVGGAAFIYLHHERKYHVRRISGIFARRD